MKTLKFKTTINCGGCIAAVSPHFNNLFGINKWQVDTQSPDKVLKIEGDDGLEASEIIEALSRLGHKAESM